MESAVERNQETVASISVLDSDGRVLASAHGRETDFEVFTFQVALESGRGRGWGKGQGVPPAEWCVEIALNSSSADFITRQAFSHAIIAAIAILTLLGLAIYFTQTLRRFLLLKSREESERHLTSLGAMSATLAHEIRNPLGAMKGLTQVVQEDLPEDHQSQGLVKTVIEEAERLEQLVTDLLAFAKPVELRLSDFNLTELLTEVVAFLTPQAEESGVVIRLESEVQSTTVHSDRDGIRQVLLNLILNAVEASPPDTEVMLQLSHDGKAKRARVEIKDHGPGIGDLTSKDLFLPFKTTKLKGSGLGLAVSKRIVDRLGGNIRLENAKDKGTQCTLEIPFRSH
jgi:signal transduction histidine kinase